MKINNIKNELINKMFFLLFIILFFFQNQQSFAQTVSLSNTRLTLKTAFTEIERQTEMPVDYNQEVINVNKTIVIPLKSGSLPDIMEVLLQGTGCTYIIKENHIVISTALVTQQNQWHITGTVIDENGEPLIGANVIVKGTTDGCVTDIEGKFSLTVSGSTILQISYVGYLSQEITVRNQQNLQVILKEDFQGLEEVVVVGYGTRAKGAITGAISTVKSDVFENRPVINSMDALQGTIPGVTIMKGNGQPGKENYSLQIRGYSSINGNVPLIMIDGMPGDLTNINPNDIDNISVLKDAAAAIYGARAADGVVLITTKKGNKGKPSIAYSGNFGLKVPHHLLKVADTYHGAAMLDEGLKNVGLPGFSDEVFDKIRSNAPPTEKGWMFGLTDFPGFYGSTDWFKETYKSSIQQSHNLTISGGGENNVYLLSAGYKNNPGIMNFANDKADAYNLQLNYDFKLFDRLNIETKSSYVNRINEEPTQLPVVISWLPRLWSFVPMYNPHGQYYTYQGFLNPGDFLQHGGNRKMNHHQFNTNFKGDFEILSGLKIIAQAATKMYFTKDVFTNPTFELYNWAGVVQNIANPINSASFTNSRGIQKIYNAYFDYNKILREDHYLNVMIGASHEEADFDQEIIVGYNFKDNKTFTLNLADKTKTEYMNFTGAINDWALQSYFSRIGYSYKNKLITDITLRTDGSSKFAPDKRWSSVFPSVALAYNLSEENIIRSLNFFDMLKLRVSWGKMGNQDIGSLGLYDYMQLISISGNYPIGSPNVGRVGAISTIASKERTWETIENKNIGLNMAALQSRLSFSIDYFNKTNNDMLVNEAVPATFGGTPPSQNQGKLRTRGFEITVGWRDKINDFEYGISFNLNDSKNKLIELKNSDNYFEGLNFARKGYPIYSYFGYVFDGIIQTQEQLETYKKLEGVPKGLGVGDAMYKDVDGDGKITAYGDKEKGLDGDMIYLGNRLPRYTFSSNVNLSYKRFYMNVFFQGVGKRTTMYTGDFSVPNYWWWYQPLQYFYGKTWTSENPDARYPRIIPGSVGYDDIKNWNWRTSANRMDNIGYLRLKVLTLGFNLPQNWCTKLNMQNARIYFSGQDLFTFSKGTREGNYDPENQNSNENAYPFNKVYSIGIDFKF
ncbi:TonB-dependent receptor [uncultured Proteiniphilum sp.]|uniref:TonB-dependent receptor n=1 Tax=uncultured Proteiniphilum sp. TaxID=497637 RepID=UPI00263033F4|nr:TonB-dependent receptor [uncultured Proteiniphilum sp.]